VIFMAVMIGLFGLSVLLGGFSTLVGPDFETLLRFGGWMPLMMRDPMQYWRALAFGLYHAGLIHIVFNLFALSQIGPIMENQIGRSRMLVLITACQLTAAAGSYVWYGLAQGIPHVPTLGASGWIFGLIGFGIAYFHTGGPGMRIYRDALVRREDPRGKPYYWIGGEPPTGVAESGTDFGDLSRGYVSITPIQLDLTDHFVLEQVKDWKWTQD